MNFNVRDRDSRDNEKKEKDTVELDMEETGDGKDTRNPEIPGGTAELTREFLFTDLRIR